MLARLGEGGFDSPAAAGAFVALITLSRGNPAGNSSGRSGSGTEANMMYGLDVSDFRTAVEKAARLPMAELKGVEQARQLANPDVRVALEEVSGDLLEDNAASYQGIKTGDDAAKRRYFWEQPVSNRWVGMQSTVDETVHYGGMQSVLNWDVTGRDMARLQGIGGWERYGVAVSQMRGLPVALFRGNKFDSNMSALLTETPDPLPAVWCFCSSSEYSEAVRRIDQKLNVTNATLIKVPFDLDRWTKVADEKYPNGLPEPYSDDAPQWIFHGHPGGSVVWDETTKRTAHGQLRTNATVLQIAVARLLGYRWPAEQDGQMELADEQREWVRRCEILLAWVDEDGIVCIPPIRGEPPAGDRLLSLLAAAFGDVWNDDMLTKLLAEAGSPTLDDWLRDHFFDLHCKLFHHRPFVWHIWDGRRSDGFHALVSYHRLAESDGNGRRLLESLTYSYLGDWITRQQDGVRRGEGGAEDRLAAALELQTRLLAILKGEPPFDIFVRWKPIEQQPIGWEPDIDDGVRLNIRPFMADDIPGGKKGAGVLRTKPNIQWKKDRGKEALNPGKRWKPVWLQDADGETDLAEVPELRPRDNYPWFWSCPDGGPRAARTDFLGGREFDGNRWNDLHYTNAAKRAARSRRTVEVD